MVSRICLAGLLLAAVGWCGQASAAPPSGPEDTTAKVQALVNDKPLALKRPEQVALMFMAAISDIEDNCVREGGHACSMDELMTGIPTKDHFGTGKLKFDPRTTDPNYIYTVNAGQSSWEAKAVPKRPGLGGFYFVQAGGGIGKNYYNPKGEASISSIELNGFSIDGDVFKKG